MSERKPQGLIGVLNYLYDKEMNCEISSFWDGGWTFRLGDKVNGFIDEGNFDDLNLGAQWLYSRFRKYVETPNLKFNREE